MEERAPSKLYNIFYRLNLILIGLLLLVAFFRGLSFEEDIIGGIILAMVLAFVFLVTPLLIPFLFLNIWGAIRFKLYRIRYVMISIILTPIITWGIYQMIYMPLP